MHQARGTWVHLLHDDDWVDPPFYAVALEVLRANPPVGIWMCGTWNEYMQTPSACYASRFIRNGFMYDLNQLATWLFGESLSRCVSTILHRESALALGGFDPALHQIVDLDLFWRMAECRGAWLCDQVLGHFRIHSASNSGVDRIQRKMGFLEDGRLIADLIHILNRMPPHSKTISPIRRYSRHVLTGAFLYHVRRGQIDKMALLARAWVTHCRCWNSILP
jgi:hypothetical protein